MDATLERFKAYVSSCTEREADDPKRETQTAVARRLGISQGRLSNILRGDRHVEDVGLAARIEAATQSWDGGPIRASEWVFPDGLPAAEADDDVTEVTARRTERAS